MFLLHGLGVWFVVVCVILKCGIRRFGGVGIPEFWLSSEFYSWCETRDFQTGIFGTVDYK